MGCWGLIRRHEADEQRGAAEPSPGCRKPSRGPHVSVACRARFTFLDWLVTPFLDVALKVVKGLDLSLFDMCVGERRKVEIPARLAYGKKGSKLFGIPPDDGKVTGAPGRAGGRRERSTFLLSPGLVIPVVPIFFLRVDS